MKRALFLVAALGGAFGCAAQQTSTSERTYRRAETDKLRLASLDVVVVAFGRFDEQPERVDERILTFAMARRRETADVQDAAGNAAAGSSWQGSGEEGPPGVDPSRPNGSPLIRPTREV